MVYLGPDPDRTLTGTIAFTEAETGELARREAILKDPRLVMQIRHGGRARWFEGRSRAGPWNDQGAREKRTG